MTGRVSSHVYVPGLGGWCIVCRQPESAHKAGRVLPRHDAACDPGCTDCHCDGDESCVRCSPVHDLIAPARTPSS